MNLIERYLYIVKKYLPDDISEDIAKELRGNINDMLPDDYTEEDVYQVLKKLGSPRKLAEEYNTKKKYLIGPSYYERYIDILKKVFFILIPISVIITLITWVINSPAEWYQIDNLKDLIVDILVACFTGALEVFMVVTIIFAIIERTNVEFGYIPSKNKEWTPKDLPQVPANNNLKISRGESIFEMIITVLIASLLYFSPQIIGMYSFADDKSIVSTTLFNLDRLKLYMPIIILFAFMNLGLFIWKLICENWNLRLAIVSAIFNFIIIVLILLMLLDKELISADFISTIADKSKSTVDIVSDWVNKSKVIFGFIVIGLTIWDSFKYIFKCLRQNKKLA